MASPVRFCVTWIVSLAVLLAAVAAFNAVIDPYDVIGAPRIAGLNQFKVTAPKHTLLTKTYQVGRIRPVTVLLGSSDVDIGLDPESGVWPEPMRPVYNFGIPGNALDEIYRNLLMAAATGRLRYAFVGLDFENFIWPVDFTRDARNEDPGDGSALWNGRSWIRRVSDLASSTFSLAALIDSVETVMAQRSRMPLDVGRTGGTNEGGFVAAASADGEFELFAQKHAEYAQRFERVAAAYHQNHDRFANTEILRAIIAFCDAHGIALTLFIPPSHADRFDMFDDAGLWSVQQAWKAKLEAIASRQDGRSTPLWDFSGYNAYSTEPVPAKRDRETATTWFWEPGHFKRALGERMLTRMLIGRPDDLGVLLTTANIAAQLEAETTARAAYHCRRGTELSKAAFLAPEACEHGG